MTTWHPQQRNRKERVSTFLLVLGSLSPSHTLQDALPRKVPPTVGRSPTSVSIVETGHPDLDNPSLRLSS